MSRPRRALAVALAALLAATLVASAVGAQEGEPTGPSIVLDRTSIRPGERVLVTLDGFDGTAVTISVCGNRAQRGSPDCNLTASEGLGLDTDGTPTMTEFPVAAPSTTCPCVVMASTTSYGEVAVAPIELIGHPVGPVVGSSTLEAVAVTVDVKRAPRGVLASLRAAVGGPTTYDVTVSVRNRSTATLEKIVLEGSAGRSRDGDLRALDLPPPPALAPGETWTHVARTEVPAPAVGTFAFTVTASGSGPAVSTVQTTRTLPLGLLLVVGMLVVDVGAIAWRRRRRRLRRGAHARRRGLRAPRPATG